VLLGTLWGTCQELGNSLLQHTSDNEDKIMGGLFLTIFIRCSYEASNFVEREIRPNQGLEFRTKAQNPGYPKSFKFEILVLWVDEKC
jgi:hypothetical protein